MSDPRMLIVVFTSILALIFAAIGAFFVYIGASGATTITMFRQSLSTSSIGVVSFFISGVMLIAIFTKVLSSLRYPPSRDASAPNPLVISWEEMDQAASRMAMALGSSKGFRPDLICGISGGGLVFADLLSKRLGHIPCLTLWADRFGPDNKSNFSEPANAINLVDLDRLFRKNNIKRVLVVDDVVYSGQTLGAAIEFLTQKSRMIGEGDVQVKSAVLFSLENAAIRANYAGYTDARLRRISPVSDALRSLSAPQASGARS